MRIPREMHTRKNNHGKILKCHTFGGTSSSRVGKTIAATLGVGAISNCIVLHVGGSSLCWLLLKSSA